jgi:hypothetical protein
VVGVVLDVSDPNPILTSDHLSSPIPARCVSGDARIISH